MTEPIIEIVRPQGARPEDLYIVGDSYFAVSREDAASLICLRWRYSEHDAYLALDKASAEAQLSRPTIYRNPALFVQSRERTMYSPEGSNFV